MSGVGWFHRGLKNVKVDVCDSHTNKTPIMKKGHGQQYLYTNQLPAIFNNF
jgi:hypothetical protein